MRVCARELEVLSSCCDSVKLAGVDRPRQGPGEGTVAVPSRGDLLRTSGALRLRECSPLFLQRAFWNGREKLVPTFEEQL